jgi:hypothetical protein
MKGREVGMMQEWEQEELAELNISWYRQAGTKQDFVAGSLPWIQLMRQADRPILYNKVDAWQKSEICIGKRLHKLLCKLQIFWHPRRNITSPLWLGDELEVLKCGQLHYLLGCGLIGNPTRSQFDSEMHVCPAIFSFRPTHRRFNFHASYPDISYIYKPYMIIVSPYLLYM